MGGASAPSGTEQPATAAPRGLLGFWAGGYSVGAEIPPEPEQAAQLLGGPDRIYDPRRRIDLTDDDFVEDDEEAIALAEQASMAATDYPEDYYDFEQDPDLGEGAQPGGAVSITADLDRDFAAAGAEASPRFVSARSMLRRTDSSSLVFNTPSDRGPFKKLGTGKVQTELSWAKPAPEKRRKIMVSMPNHDDDGDE